MPATMMHMSMWFGYDLGEFMFPGLDVKTRWAFALTWIVLFLVSVMFEGSKVYLARVQREAQRKLYPYRSNERRNLLCDRDQGCMEPTSSRNATDGSVSRWASLRTRILVNSHQSSVFVAHNATGYLLMLAVMVYNAELLFAVVLGMMLGYFLFGTKLTMLQMQCFRSKRNVICTPDCDDTAEGTTPPLLSTSLDSESDFFICRTRTCITPSHYHPAHGSDPNDVAHASCYYGAKKCPSKVARAKRTQPVAGPSHCSTHHADSEKEDSPSVEDVQLLRTERRGCCKKQEPSQAGESSSHVEAAVSEPKSHGCCKKRKEEAAPEVVPDAQEREHSPQITCCRGISAPSDSQEQIIQ